MSKTEILEKWLVAGQQKRLTLLRKAQEEEQRTKDNVALQAELELRIRNILAGNPIPMELKLNKQTGNWELSCGSITTIELDPRNLIPELLKSFGAEMPYPRVEEIYVGDPPPPAPAIPRNPPEHRSEKHWTTT